MKKLYSFMIALIATTVMSSSIYAQADLAALSKYEIAEDLTTNGFGYKLDVYFQNVGDATFTNGIVITAAFYTLDEKYVISTQTNISASNIEAGNEAGLGFTFRKDIYPFSQNLTPGLKYKVKVTLANGTDGNEANNTAWLMDGLNKWEFHYYPSETPGTSEDGFDLTFAQGAETATTLSEGGLAFAYYFKNAGTGNFSGPIPIDLRIKEINTNKSYSVELDFTRTENLEIAKGATLLSNFALDVTMFDELPDGTYAFTLEIADDELSGTDANLTNNTYSALVSQGGEMFHLIKNGTNYSTTTGIKDITENTGLNIYPNPVTNNATIQFSLKQSSNVSLKIYNAIGGLVKEIENAQLLNGAHQYSLNTANFEKGMYFYVLETSEGRISKRFIKE